MHLEKVVIAVAAGLMGSAGVAKVAGVMNTRPGLQAAAVYLFMAGVSVTLLPLATLLVYLVYMRFACDLHATLNDMGVEIRVFEFDGTPPSEEQFLSALGAQVGDISGVESYGVLGNRVEVGCLHDPYTAPYTTVILQCLGGRPIPWRHLAVPTLPWYVQSRWIELSRWARWSIWLRWRWRNWTR